MPETAHLGDSLSALIDGELDGAAADAARRHLADCEGCRDEYAATEAVARLVRGLPPVDPRFGFYERLTRPGGFATARRSSLRIGLVVATAAALVAVVVGVAGDLRGGSVAPPVDDMMAVHHAGFLPPVAADQGFEPKAADAMGTPFAAPMEVVSGYERQGVYERDSDHIVAVTYRADGEALSVFEQSGALDTNAIDASMEPMAGDAWAMDSGDLRAIVIDRGHLVYTVIGSAPLATLMAVVHDLPEAPSPSLWQRARDASTDVVWTFGLG